MPKFHVTSPDGRTIEVNAPDGATEDQAIKYAQDNWDTLSKQSIKQPTQVAQPVPTVQPEVPYWKRVLNAANEVAGSVIEPPLKMATGAIAKPLGDIAGMAASGYEALTGNQNSADMPQQFGQSVQQGLTYQPRTVAGASNINPLNAIPNAAGYVVNSIGQGTGNLAAKGATALGASPEVAQGFQRGVAEAVPQAIGIGLTKLGQSNLASLPEKQAALDATKAQNAATDAIRSQGQKIGLIAPATSGIKQTAESMTKSLQAVSNKNAIKATDAFRHELDMPKNSNLAPDSLSKIAEGEYQNYNNLVKEADLPQVYTTSPTSLVPKKITGLDLNIGDFKQNLFNLLDDAKGKDQLSQTFIENKKTIPMIEQHLQNNYLSPQVALSAIKTLREQARSGFNGTLEDAAAANTRLDIANQLEGVFEQNLAKYGKGDVLDKFRASREKLAKINFVSNVVNDAGVVNIRKAAALSNKYPLTGNLKTVAQFGDTFPEATLKPSSKGALSFWDATVAGGSAMAGHLGTAAGELIGRGGVPILAEKGMLQNAAPSYQVGNMYKSGAIAAPYGLGVTTPSLSDNMFNQRNNK